MNVDWQADRKLSNWLSQEQIAGQLEGQSLSSFSIKIIDWKSKRKIESFLKKTRVATSKEFCQFKSSSEIPNCHSLHQKFSQVIMLNKSSISQMSTNDTASKSKWVGRSKFIP